MNRRLLKLILVLVSMLFLNIEAAHAGLVTKLKLFIQAEIPPQHLLFLAAGLCSAALFGYVVFTPLHINNERLTWLSYFGNSEKNTMRHKRLFVKRTSSILMEKKAA